MSGRANASPSRGVTLIELLVTLVVSSIVIIGLGTIFAGAASDYERAARGREERYSRQLLEAELVWRIKSVPPEYLPSPVDIPALGAQAPLGFTINYTDERGPQKRKILAFDYVRNDTRQFYLMNPPGGLTLPIAGTGCSQLVPDNGNGQKVQVRTAAIFQYYSTVYVVEQDINVLLDSFREKARLTTLEGFLTPMFNTPPVIPPGVIPPTPLAIGIDTFDMSVVDPVPMTAPCNTVDLRDQLRQRRVIWSYTQYY